MLEISIELTQQIHDYLVSRPMREVEQLVHAVRELKPLESLPAKDE